MIDSASHPRPLEQQLAEVRRAVDELSRRLQAETQARVAAEDALRLSEERQRRQASVDPLTGLLASHLFHPALESELERARRYREPVGLLLLDLDDLKAINQRHGRDAGDRALAHLGEVLRTSLRKIDSAYRYGDEEFTVILPRCDAPALAGLAERIRSHFADVDAPLAQAGLSLSVGAAIYRRGEAIGSFIRRADQALCQAKAAGKNQVVVAGGCIPT